MMSINLSQQTQTILETIVELNPYRTPAKLNWASSNDSKRENEVRARLDLVNYFHTIDVINASEKPRLKLDRSIKVSEYKIPGTFSDFIIPEAVRVVNDELYTDLVLRPDLTLPEVNALTFLEPEEFNKISKLFCEAMKVDLVEVSRNEVLLSTVLSDKFFVVNNAGMKGYDKSVMPYILKDIVTMFIEPEAYTTGFDFGKHVKAFLLKKSV